MIKTAVCGALALYGSRWCINQGTKHFSTLRDLVNQYNVECIRQPWALERYLTASAPLSSNTTENEYLPVTNLPTAEYASTPMMDRSFEMLQLERDEAVGSYEIRTTDTRKALEDLAGKCSELSGAITRQLESSVGYLALGGAAFLLGTAILFRQ